MKSYPLQKIDTNLYVKGLSGPLVYHAAYAIIAGLLFFVLLYILCGTFIAVVTCVPLFFAYLYRLHRIQQKLGPLGWEKKKVAKKLPRFILIRRRICQLSKP